MDKHLVSAMVLIVFGFGLTQLENSGPFYSGIGWGTIGIASIWLLVRLIMEIKKK